LASTGPSVAAVAPSARPHVTAAAHPQRLPMTEAEIESVALGGAFSA